MQSGYQQPNAQVTQWGPQRPPAVDVTKVFGAFHHEYAEHAKRAEAAKTLADRLATAVHDAAEAGLDAAFMRRVFDLTMDTHDPGDPDDDAPAWTQDFVADDDAAGPDDGGFLPDDDAPSEWIATIPGEPSNRPDLDDTDDGYPPDAEYDSYEADQDAMGHDGYAELRAAA